MNRHLPRTARLSIALVTVLAALSTLAPPGASAHHLKEGDVRFKTTCNLSHTAADDPIVFPGQPGAAHAHDFFGNKGINASTTTFRALTKGASTTCNNALDLASYWVPEVISDGVKIAPLRMTAYYRLGGKHTKIQPYPPGLKVIAGYSHHLGPSAHAGWQCGEVPGNDPLPVIPEGCADLNMVVAFPDCWDGVNLDSSDHRSHMAYSVPGTDANRCPSTHPVPVPDLTTFVNYASVPAGATLSSGDQSTVHGDFFNGWDRRELKRLIDECLNAGVFCESGGTTVGIRHG